MRNTVAILGIPIDALHMHEVLERIDQFIASRRMHQIATANTDFLVKAVADGELRSILRMCDLVVADGYPVVTASKLLRAGLPERVTGADMVPLLAARAAERGYRVFILGGRPDVVAAARDRLVARYPGLRIVGCVSPPVSHIVEMDNEAILAEIEAAAPDLLLVAFGCPKQEKWVHMHRSRLRVPVCIGVGATFDFIAGASVRAPLWMQRAGLEWLHRLAREPGRLWRRYWMDFVSFTRLMLLHLWVMGRETSGVARLAAVRVGGLTVVSVIGHLGRDALGEFQLIVDQALNAGNDVVLDLHGTPDIDSAALGTLVNLPKRAAFVGRQVRLVGVGPRIRSALRVANATDLLTAFGSVAEAIRGEAPSALRSGVLSDGEGAVIWFAGQVVQSSLHTLSATLEQAPGTARRIDVDLRSCMELDSSALQALNRFVRLRSEAGATVRLIATGPVREYIRGEGLGALFTIADEPIPMESHDEQRDPEISGR